MSEKIVFPGILFLVKFALLARLRPVEGFRVAVNSRGSHQSRDIVA